MKNKVIIVCMLLLSCLPTLHAGRHSSNFGAAAIGAAAGMFLGAALANGNSNHCTHTCSHTEYVHAPQYYTERVEVCRPVVETRRVYSRPARVVTHYSRPCETVYYNRAYTPVYTYNQYSTYY
jgi:hypothetical protein